MMFLVNCFLQINLIMAMLENLFIPRLPLLSASDTALWPTQISCSVALTCIFISFSMLTRLWPVARSAAHPCSSPTTVSGVTLENRLVVKIPASRGQIHGGHWGELYG